MVYDSDYDKKNTIKNLTTTNPSDDTTTALQDPTINPRSLINFIPTKIPVSVLVVPPLDDNNYHN